MSYRRTSAWFAAVLIVVAAGNVVSAQEKRSEGSWLGVRLDGRGGSEQGVLVSRIFEGSPADRAGLRASDVIVGFEGEPVAHMGDLVRKIRRLDSGAWVGLKVIRQGDEIELDARLGERPGQIKNLEVRHGWIGVESINLPESLREHFGAPPDAGVMLSEVAEGSPAEAAGLRIGDVVYEIGGEPVVSRRAFREQVARAGVGNEQELTVARYGAELVVETAIRAAPPRSSAEGR
jgi:S1-C subfamily serine protease